MDILFTDSSPEDETLAEVIRDAGNVVLPLIGIGNQVSGGGMVMYDSVLPPVPVLLHSTGNTGHANISPDSDGTIRRLPLFIGDSAGEIFPAFSLSVLNRLFGMDMPTDSQISNGSIHLLARDIPVDENYSFRINFSPEDKNRPYLSYSDVISGNFNPSLVENKIVLIGMMATGGHDMWEIPGTAEKVSGVMIHADIIDNILNQNYLVSVSPGISVLILLLMVGITGIALPRFELRRGLLLTAILFLGYLLIGFICYENGYILDILYPLSVLPVIYVGNIAVRNSANMIENSRLNQQLLEGYTGTIRALAAAIEAKDKYTRGHSLRVTELTMMGAVSLNLSADESSILEYAAILHDIGKIGISGDILTKPGRLDDAELEQIRRHPEIGAGIIENVPFLKGAGEIVLHHHERYDGKGYPSGLAGENIPLGSRLIAVADTYDSMTSNRAYRPAMDISVAIEEVSKCTGTQFCPVAVKAFLKGLKVYLENLPENHSGQR
jgi:CHASE2 domain-containing sensor protein